MDIRKEIKILQWNCCGILNKINTFTVEAQDYDIILLNETWLSKEDRFFIPNFNIIRNDRNDPTRTYGGGVLIALKKTIPYKLYSEIYNSPGFIDQLQLKYH